MTTRRTAREQALPEDQAQRLLDLKDTSLFTLCRDLYNAGWPLRAIGEAFEPPKSRSTVRSWIQRVDPAPPPSEDVIPRPTLKTPAEYVPRKPVTPSIPSMIADTIRDEAIIARRYRSGMSPDHKATLANAHLTALVKTWHDNGVPVQELADTAGVTYRAMAKRLGKVK